MSVFAGGARQSILSATFANDDELFQAYMPFIKRGGLFVRPSANQTFQLELGRSVFVTVVLPGSTERLPVSGKVSWVTPEGAQGNRPAGVGVQFDDTREGALLKDRIETLLAGRLESDRATWTM